MNFYGKSIFDLSNMHINVFYFKYKWNNYVKQWPVWHFDLLNKKMISFFGIRSYLFNKYLEVNDKFDFSLVWVHNLYNHVEILIKRKFKIKFEIQGEYALDH